MATSVTTSDGTWAAVAMGQLDQPLNTFWQLFHLPAGSTQWSDQVEATAVATNGGIVLGGAGKTVLAGLLPSNKLTFTPMISSGNGGQSWQNGLIDAGLADVPDSLASDGAGHTIALVGTGGTGQVLAADGDLSAWSTLTTESALAATPDGRRCGLDGLTAVAYAGPHPLVAGRCSHPGVTPLFTDGPSGWHAATQPVPAAGGAQVLGLRDSGPTLTGLFATTSGGAVNLEAGWSTDDAKHWAFSPPLPLRGSEQITSFGTARGTGAFVLLSDQPGPNRLEVIGPPDSSWTQLPAPPPGTATITMASGSPPQALAVDNADLTVWTLPGSGDQWTKGQVVHVDLQPGSSG